MLDRLSPILRWSLTDGLRDVRLDVLLEEVLGLLAEAGLEISRANVTCLTLHPQLAADCAEWSDANGLKY